MGPSLFTYLLLLRQELYLPWMPRPYLGSHFSAGNHYSTRTEIIREEWSGILSNCFISVIAVLLTESVYITHKASTCTEMSRTVNVTSAVLLQGTGVQTDTRVLGSSLTLRLHFLFFKPVGTVGCQVMTNILISSSSLIWLCPLLGTSWQILALKWQQKVTSFPGWRQYLKEQFTPISKTHILPLICSAI